MKNLFVLSALILSITMFSCGNSGEKKQDDGNTPVTDTSKGVSAMAHDSLNKDQASLVYICPCGGCPEVKESKPGKCPKCEMDLTVEKK